MDPTLSRTLFRAARLAPCALLVVAVSCQKPEGKSAVAIRQEGLPATLTELNAWYPAVPDSENAAIAYTIAGDLLHAPAMDMVSRLPIAGDADLPDPNVPLSGDMRSVIDAYLASNDAALVEAGNAVKLTKARFPIDLSDGMKASLPHLSPLRSIARLFALKAIERAEANDAATACDALRGAFATGESLKMEPLLISQLVRIACHAVAAQAAERVVNRAGLTDVQRAAVENLALSIEDPDLVFRAFVGERCIMSEELAKSPGAATPINSSGETLAKELYSPDARRQILVLLDRAIDAARLPSADRGKVMAPLAAENSADTVAQQMARGTIKAYLAHDSDSATLRVLACGIAVKRYRLATNAWPDSLDALVPKFIAAVPVDPFDGHPLRYKQADDKVIVYSLGRNRDDDGGAPFAPSDTATPGGDIIFRCYAAQRGAQ